MYILHLALKTVAWQFEETKSMNTMYDNGFSLFLVTPRAHLAWRCQVTRII